jgi:hypothetical protein
MKLFYRGVSYDYDPILRRPGNTGRPVKLAQTQRSPYALTYRGITHQVDPNAPAADPALPAHYRLMYRGTEYEVNRAAQGGVTIATQPVGMRGFKAEVVPSVMPRHYIAKVHQTNLLRNLQHRLQVAQERGDQKLIHLLEAERQQILAGNH